MNEREVLNLLTGLAPTYDVRGEELRAARARVDAAIAAEAAAARRGGRRPQGRWLGAAAGVCAVAVGGVLWPSGTSGAYATWTAAPTGATADQVRTARTACEQVLAPAFTDIGASGPAARPPSWPGSVEDLAGQQLLVGEQRGDVTLVVTSNPTWVEACLAAPSVTPLLTEVGMVDLRRHPAAVPSSSVDVLSAQSEGAGATSAAVVVGRAGDDVSGVRVTTRGGRTVQARTSGGYWSAWWPTDPGQAFMQATVAVTLADGSTRDAGTLGDLSGAGS